MKELIVTKKEKEVILGILDNSNGKIEFATGILTSVNPIVKSFLDKVGEHEVLEVINNIHRHSLELTCFEDSEEFKKILKKVQFDLTPSSSGRYSVDKSDLDELMTSLNSLPSSQIVTLHNSLNALKDIMY